MSLIKRLINNLVPRRFVRIRHCDGGWFLCTQAEAFSMLIACDEPVEYMAETVYMTQAKFDALPEFDGF